MGSLAITIQPPTESPHDLSIFEVNHHAYAAEVLGLDDGITEDIIDARLVAKANSLGIAASTLQKRTTSSAFSSSSTGSYCDQPFSPISSPVAATPHSSVFTYSSTDLPCGNATNFASYDHFITSPNSPIDQACFRKGSLPAMSSSAQSVSSVNTSKSFSSVKSGFKPRAWWKKKLGHTQSCHGCRSPLAKMASLHALSCSHTYCSECLRYIASQASTNEESMPPRCCSQPITSRVLRDALDRDTQQLFLKAVAHFSTPKHARVYCPNSLCGEFINTHQVVNHKHPFDVTCLDCLTRACRMCKQAAHPIGVDCPDDWELEAVKKMGQSANWKRCYSCRNLVSVAKGSTHMTCRCKEEMCQMCGGIWDRTTGCPNLCGDENELAKRDLDGQVDDQDETALAVAAKEQEDRAEAEKRSFRNPTIQILMSKQVLELNRFCAFSARARSSMQTRQATEKLTLLERHIDDEDGLRERHSKATSSLEDRQIAAEMELRGTLEQMERSVNIRLKHMEAYCQGRSSENDKNARRNTTRVVTEENLKELGQQYSLRDGMARQNQAKINVMRERQARRMEELLDKQETEAETLLDKQRDESSAQTSKFTAEKEGMTDTLRRLQIRLIARWSLQLDVRCKELEEADNVRYGPVQTPAWPQEEFYAEQSS